MIDTLHEEKGHIAEAGVGAEEENIIKKILIKIKIVVINIMTKKKIKLYLILKIQSKNKVI